ncbi:hypothetical protein BDK92_2996 [Micromonospora pisi]|uniref:Uncharacterized protein n=1 Tax=Micromonospora pisi TaxID=589240 RepID=A0A495JIC4_9ACTN|nr:hypothetical protein [Micromonospora pisi]RKR88667.1 hypothetical protein BDK92_2996 [Micromonospora pisi]
MPEPRAARHPVARRPLELRHQPLTQHQQGGGGDPEAELRRLAAECSRLSHALMIRDAPGLPQSDRQETAGATARAWQDVQWRIGELAAQLAAAQQVLDRAELLRRRQPGAPVPAGPDAGPDAAPASDLTAPNGAAELTALLHGPCEVVLTGATGAPAEVVRLPLPEVIKRAGEHHAAIVAVAEAVASARTVVVGQLDPLARRFAELRTRALAVAVPAEVLTGAEAEFDTLRRVADRDPLGAVDGVTWRAARERLAAQLTELGVRLGRAEELRVRLPSLVDELRLLIGRLDADETEARYAWRGLTAIPGPRTGTEPAVAGSGAAPGAAEFGAPVPQAGALRVRLRAVERRCRHGQWWDAVDEAAEPAAISAAVTAAAERAVRARDAAGLHRQRLHELRVELRGRLDAFQRKAFSLGRSEDLSLTDLYNEARRQLRAEPFDAEAADRAVTRYLYAVNEEGQA